MRKACTAHKFTLASNLFSEGVVAFSRTEQHSNGLSQRRLQHLVLTSQLRPFATVFGYVCTKTWHAWEAKQSVSPRWWRDALGVNSPWNQQPPAQNPLPLWVQLEENVSCLLISSMRTRKKPWFRYGSCPWCWNALYLSVHFSLSQILTLPITTYEYRPVPFKLQTVPHYSPPLVHYSDPSLLILK